MDGSKKIIVLSMWLLFVFLITACNVQKTAYVSLYVDGIDYTQDSLIVETNDTVVANDTIYEKEVTNDTLMYFKLNDKNNISDSLYHSEITEVLNKITDSLHTLNVKLDSALQAKNIVINNIITYRGVPCYSDSLTIKNDTIQQVKKKLQYKEIIKVDTVYVKDTVFIEKKTSFTEDDDVELLKKQLLAKNDTIQQLKKQSQPQNNTIKKKEIVYIRDTVIIEKNSSKNFNNQKEIEDVEKQLVAKNDTIQQLKKQLRNNPKTITNTITKTEVVYVKDTVIIEKTSSKNFNNQKEIEDVEKQLVAKNDTIQQLKKQIEGNSQNNITKTDTIFIENKINKILDTTFIAHYQTGKIVPNDNIISQVINVFQNNKVDKIEISGFTDNSGSFSVNKKITDKRINHIISKISSYIATEKIYYQNFGETFASENTVEEERRVELKMYYNIKD